MASIRSVSVLAALALSLGLVACGSSDDDDGGGGTNIDAAPTSNIDASMPVDAAGGGSLTGLGQTCTGPSQCPTTAPDCIGAPGATNGFCTKQCATNVMLMTNAQGQFSSANPNPTSQNAACAAIYTGTVGTPQCLLITTLNPNHNPPMPNTAYTGTFSCGITCGQGNTCPTGMTCQQGGCYPP